MKIGRRYVKETSDKKLENWQGAIWGQTTRVAEEIRWESKDKIGYPYGQYHLDASERHCSNLFNFR